MSMSQECRAARTCSHLHTSRTMPTPPRHQRPRRPRRPRPQRPSGTPPPPLAAFPAPTAARRPSPPLPPWCSAPGATPGTISPFEARAPARGQLPSRRQVHQVMAQSRDHRPAPSRWLSGRPRAIGAARAMKGAQGAAGGADGSAAAAARGEARLAFGEDTGDHGMDAFLGSGQARSKGEG